MNVASLPFLAFATLVVLLHGAWRNVVWRKSVSLMANLAFLLSFTHSPGALAPLAAFLLLGYASVVLARSVRAVPAAAFAAGIVVLFCWLKRYWFFSFAPGLPFAYATIGLSYACFRILGMILDARDEPAIADAGPVSFLNFTLNFPTFVAGPIDRYQDFIVPDLPVTIMVIGDSLQRIVLGFFKVLVLAVIVQRWQISATTALLAQSDAQETWMQALPSFGLYPVFLYFNFSGYTDIVLGIGALLGKRYPENFDDPFSSHNFIEFWSRWHMSLSFWLRDYLYTPLLRRSMRLGLPVTIDPYLGVLCFFVTFFVIGIWHGSTKIFAIYGLLLGLGVSINKLYQVGMTAFLGKGSYRRLSGKPTYRMACRGLTYGWYCLCMACFWNNAYLISCIYKKLGLHKLLIVIMLIITIYILTIVFINGVTYLISNLKIFSYFNTRNSYVRSIYVGILISGCILMSMLDQSNNPLIVYQLF